MVQTPNLNGSRGVNEPLTDYLSAVTVRIQVPLRIGTAIRNRVDMVIRTEERPGRLSQVGVLVVEDDPAGARLLVALFESEGAIVRWAPSAEDGLVILSSFAATVLIVDLVLPAMSGFAFVEQCKTLYKERLPVAVAVSALNGPQLETRAVQSGCAAYVRKPIDLEHLVRVVIAQLKGAK